MRVKLLAIGVLLVWSIACSQSPTTTAPVPLRIAKDTTFILSPLRPDGTPDYLEAYNARLPQIAADKNAFAFILQAAGPLPDFRRQEQMLTLLHLPPFPKDARFLQSLSQFAGILHPGAPGQPSAESDNAARIESAMSTNLLAQDDQALVSQWLDAQAEPMKLIEQAAALSACVIPLCAQDDEHAIMDAQPLVSGLMRCTEPFCARANLRAARADFAGAQRDLVIGLRLARLVQQTPFLIVRLIGSADEMRVCRTARIIALSTPMTAAQADSLADALAQVPLAPTLADTYAIGERFDTLDLYTQIARGKGAHLLRLELMIFDNSTPVDEGDLKEVDWNVILRSANKDADQSAKIFSSRDWRLIRRDLRAEESSEPVHADTPIFPASSLFLPGGLHVDVAKEWEKDRNAVLAFLHKRPGESREQFTNRIQQLFAGPKAVEDHFANLLITRALEFPLTRTTLALAAFHADHGAWPESLSDLIPHYLPSLPEDPFSENPLLYRTTRAGFLLYSVGPNGKDDAGNKDSEGSQDDIAVSFPLAPTENPATPGK